MTGVSTGVYQFDSVVQTVDAGKLVCIILAHGKLS